jgi:ArsR family transcriptional regulator, arsenate/arsenite/antimonite-responsive transcriptional repressor
MVRKLIIQEVARAKGISSMAGLQRVANLDRNTAQRVWRNRLYGARPATLEKIARALGVLPEELFIEDGENSQEHEVQALVEHVPPSQPEPSSDLPLSDLFAPTLTEEEAARIGRVLKALAEPTRLRLLSQLARYGRQVSVSELASAHRLAQPTVSSHLQVLLFTGLISVYKDEQWNYYYLNRDAIRGVVEFLMHTLIDQDESHAVTMQGAKDQAASYQAGRNDHEQ